METDIQRCYLCMNIISNNKDKEDHYPLVFETCQNYLKNEVPHTQHNSTNEKKFKPLDDLPSLCSHCMKSAEKLWGMDLELELVKNRINDYISQFKLDIKRRANSAIKVKKLSDDKSWKHEDLNGSNVPHIQIKMERDPLEIDQDYEDATPYCPNPNMKDLEGSNDPSTIDGSGNDQLEEILPKKRRKKTKKIVVKNSKKCQQPRRKVKECVTLNTKNGKDINIGVKELPNSSDGMKKLMKGYQCSECTTLFGSPDQLVCTICQTKKNESKEEIRKNFKNYNLKRTRGNRDGRNDDSCEKKTYFPCTYCDMIFPKKCRLQSHLLNVHLNSEVDGSEINACTVCDIVYDSAELYLYHMQVKHNST